MSSVRINSLTLQGFRSFGRAPQSLPLSAPIAVIQASNSQGKTSLAEAVEFLLTGEIVRRQLLASSQDEFADALRHAHLPAAMPVFVEARLRCEDEVERTVRRTLVSDYGKGRYQDCQTTLEIDGKLATEADLLALGVVLSKPPLRAPVLAQHTLSYLFSARPQERNEYFRALLEVSDIEGLRQTVASLDAEVKPSDTPVWTKLSAARGVSELAPIFRPFLAGVPASTVLTAGFDGGTIALITAAGQPVPATARERLTTVADILATRRALVLPLQAFDRKQLPPLTTPAPATWQKLQIYLDERTKVDEQTRRLTALFKEALNLPVIAAATEPINCPLCGTPVSLTPAQIAHIRTRVADTDSYRTAEEHARQAFTTLRSSVQTLVDAIKVASPRFLATTSTYRRSKGFTVARIRQVAGDDVGVALVDAWLQKLRPLARDQNRALRALASIHANLTTLTPETLVQVADLKAAYATCTNAVTAFRTVLASYHVADLPLRTHLQATVDAASDVKGWQEFLDLADDLTGLRETLIDRAARTALARELTRALSAIRKANEQVLEDKFAVLSGDVETWWYLLRPDEPTFFTAVKPRPGTTRTIDFKAGLASGDDHTTATIRDVIAVFSQSQLHCLGLSLFLARAVYEGASFVVLDDPVLSSDETYRAFFNTAVVERLLTLGLQIIILTQDQRTLADLETRYLHLGIAAFELVIDSPLDGTMIIHTSDTLEALLERGRILGRSPLRELRKQTGSTLRDGGERFCKEMLVKKRNTEGDQDALITDYDGQNLGSLVPLVEPLLRQDPSHPGKLRTVNRALNPANHDDGAPGSSVLKQAIDDLRDLKRRYLR
jgi:hypothetical protein